MIKAIAFDKDGTLLRYDRFWLPIAQAAATQLLADRGLDAALLPHLCNSVGVNDGIAGILCHGTYAEAAQAMNATLAAIVPAFVPLTADEVAAAFARNINRGEIVSTCPDIAGVFARLRAQGLILAVITSDNAAMTDTCLRQLGLAETFDAVYVDDGAHPTKPAPYYMHRFCAEFSLQPAEVLMVGDTPTDMSFAANSGAHAIGVAANDNDRAILAPHATRVLSHIGEIFSLLQEK